MLIGPLPGSFGAFADVVVVRKIQLERDHTRTWLHRGLPPILANAAEWSASRTFAASVPPGGLAPRGLHEADGVDVDDEVGAGNLHLFGMGE